MVPAPEVWEGMKGQGGNGGSVESAVGAGGGGRGEGLEEGVPADANSALSFFITVYLQHCHAMYEYITMSFT